MNVESTYKIVVNLFKKNLFNLKIDIDLKLYFYSLKKQNKIITYTLLPSE